MNIDDNAFICTRKKINPPFGPFGVRGDKTYEICVSNTFGDVREQLNFAREDRELNFYYERGLEVATVLIGAVSTFVIAQKNAHDVSSAADNAVSGDCQKVLSFYANLYIVDFQISDLRVSQDIVEAYQKWVNACLERQAKTRVTEIDELLKVVKNSPEPEERYNFASKVTGVASMNGYEKFLFGIGVFSTLVSVFELARTTTKNTNELLYLPEQEKLLSQTCKYATSREYLPLRFCNFKADAVADEVKKQCSKNLAPITKKNFCYLPALGYNPQGEYVSPEDIGFIVKYGIKVIFNNSCVAPDTEYGGIGYLNKFLLDLGTSISLRGAAIALSTTPTTPPTPPASAPPSQPMTILGAVELQIDEAADSITCNRASYNIPIMQTPTEKPLSGNIIKYVYTIPRVLDYKTSVNDISVLQNCNDKPLGIPQHYQLVGEACHQFGDQVKGADYD